MNVATARDAIVTALETQTAVTRIYREMPDKVEAPALVVGNPEIEFDDTMHGTVVYRFPVALVASRAADSRRAVEKLDDLIPTVAAALDSDGAAQVLRAFDYNAHSYSWGGVDYAGITFEVEVYG